MPIIYKTICLINNKIYIGQHYTDANDGYLGSGLLIKKAILKYNKKNFKREILEECDTAIINEREIWWIDFLHSRDQNIGYNLSLGGNPGTALTDEIKKKISKTLKGRILTEEHKNKISKSNKGNSNWLGKHCSEEHKKKLSLANKGHIPWIAGKHHKKETKLKIKLANLGKHKKVNNSFLQGETK